MHNLSLFFVAAYILLSDPAKLILVPFREEICLAEFRAPLLLLLKISGVSVFANP